MHTVAHYFRHFFTLSDRLYFSATSAEITMHDAIRLSGLDGIEIDVTRASQPDGTCQSYSCRYRARRGQRSG